MRRTGRLFPPIPKLTQRNVRPDAAIGQIRPIQTRRHPIYVCSVLVGTTAVGALRENHFDQRPGHRLGDLRQLGGQETDAEIGQAMPQAHGARSADHRELATPLGGKGRNGRGRRKQAPVGLRSLSMLHRQAVQGGVGHLGSPMESSQRPNVSVRGSGDWPDLAFSFAPDRNSCWNAELLLSGLDAAEVGSGSIDASRQLRRRHSSLDQKVCKLVHGH